VLSVFILVAGSVGGPAAAPGPAVARAAVMAADASDYVPSVASLPGFREESTNAEGGDFDPTIALRRSYVALDGSRRVVIDVTVGSSIANAQAMLMDRVNQLIRYDGWSIGRTDAIVEGGYAGGGPGPDGTPVAMFAFRLFAVMAEVTVTGPGDDPDVPLLDNVARLVVARIQNEPDAVIPQVGLQERPPAEVPGTEPVVFQPGPIPGTGGATLTGAEVNGASTGSVIIPDTIVTLAISAIDRPWAYTGSAPRPPEGMEYLTVEPTIQVVGQTQVTMAPADFSISTFDGRSWAPVNGRAPSLQPGPIAFGSPVHGWLTFLIPTNQSALQLTWRLRTSQSLAAQSDADQTISVPLTVGANGQASVGRLAPPPDTTVVPPSIEPGSSGGPAGSSGSSSSGSGSGGSGSGGSGNSGGGSSRGGVRLQ
jgi:hypothetical protein